MFTKLEERQTELSHLRFRDSGISEIHFCILWINEGDIISHFEIMYWDTTRLFKGALNVLLIVSSGLLYRIKERHLVLCHVDEHEHCYHQHHMSIISICRNDQNLQAGTHVAITQSLLVMYVNKQMGQGLDYNPILQIFI